MSVPDVLGELTAVLAADLTANTFTLWAPANRYSDFNVVGWAGPENASVASQQSPTDYGLQQNLDNYDVTVQLVAWAGNADPLPSVQRVFTRLKLLEAALAADATLGGTCMLAQITTWSLIPDVTTKGAQAVLTPIVNVQATAGQ